ncbi:MAG TPA: ATPase, T2SS/T4P/T4SS family, partial [Candidatus Eremiobacteraeota bacterium]|nr:ATPase, T2SS/T4P/T4SS family [Candidatus Eremiobacteraeota bacterium]
MLGRLFTGKEKNDKEKKTEEQEESVDIFRKTRSTQTKTKRLTGLEIEKDRIISDAIHKVPKSRKVKDIEIVKTNITGSFNIEDLLEAMSQIQTSELYINPGISPCFRLYGELVKSDMEALAEEECKELLYQACTEEQIEDLETSGEVSFSFKLKEKERFRVSISKEFNGFGGVFKRIPSEIIPLSPALDPLTHYKRGLVIISGPSDSGKSTTAASIIEYINQNREELIITIENPVEFIYENKKSIIIQREIGTNVYSSKEALQSALRENPDVIFIGAELRDMDNILLTLKAAEMGSLVLCVLHMDNAMNSIKKILSFFPPDKSPQMAKRLSSVLKAIISHKLIPKQDKKGQCLAMEIMFNSREISDLINKGNID